MIKLVFYDFCNICKYEYPDYEFIENTCITCYGKEKKYNRKMVNSIRNFYKRINDIGGYVVGEYKGANLKVDCICQNGHFCNPRPDSIQQRKGMCKICAGNDSETAKQNFYHSIGKLDGTVTGEYKAVNIPVDCICKNGHFCNPIPNSIQQGKGMCKICAGNDSETAKQNFYDNIEKLSGKITGKYKTANTRVDCICPNGHHCKPNPNSIQQGRGMCKICAGHDSETAKQNFYDNIQKLDGTVTGEYKGFNISVDCICKNGHFCNPCPNSIQQGKGMCKICAGNDSETAKQNFYDNIEKLGGKVTGEYKSKNIPVNCICKNGHFCNTCPANIRQGQGMCVLCCHKGYSKISIKWLNSISDDIQHAENKCEFKIPNIGKVDGYNNKTNTVYEFHGCFWHGCQKCYKSDYVNPINYTKASDLYSKTIERSLAIRNAGYNLVEIWECDFKEN